MDAMAGTSTSVDGLFIHSPGSLASFMSSFTNGATPPLLHPDLLNTVSSHRNRLSGGVRSKGKLFLLQEKVKGVGELRHPTRRMKPSQATSPTKKKAAAAASSSPSRPAPWAPLMMKARSMATSTRNDRLRIPKGVQPQGPPRQCLSFPVVHPSSPMSHRRVMLCERRHQGVMKSLP
jgi:hypothetical protein